MVVSIGRGRNGVKSLASAISRQSVSLSVAIVSRLSAVVVV